MYRNSSPIFDVPEFPILRRVKPLPKRRRTSMGSATNFATDAVDGLFSDEEHANPVPFAMPNIPELPMSLSSLPPFPVSLSGAEVTPEEIFAQADTISSHIALQNYYLPILGGVRDLIRSVAASDASGVAAAAGIGLAELDSHLSSVFGGVNNTGGGADTDSQGDGDYFDHLQQPGNAKKRKVPANAYASLGGRDSGSTQSGEEDESTETKAILTGRPEETSEVPSLLTATLASLNRRKGRMPAVTRAGIKHKETLKSRKRQLAAVLGALSHGDTLALDQALSANYPFTTGDSNEIRRTDPQLVRLSRRRAARVGRAAKLAVKLRHPDHPGLAVGDFTYQCTSETADRLIATKEEVTELRTKFEEELTRQAANAAKLAASSRLKGSGKGKKHTDRAQQKARTATHIGGKAGDQVAEFLDQGMAANGGKKTSGKKKKRSALANASNPHHLRNYVPSRLPHSGSQNNPAQAGNDWFQPLPIRFLSAEIPPRKQNKVALSQSLPQLTNPADEWICAYCEYELFFGDDNDHRRAIRKRKKILRRRRRAQERAAAAASGNSMAKIPEKGSKDEEGDAGFDPAADDFGATLPKQTKWKGDPHKDRERGETASNG